MKKMIQTRVFIHDSVGGFTVWSNGPHIEKTATTLKVAMDLWVDDFRSKVCNEFDWAGIENVWGSEVK